MKFEYGLKVGDRVERFTRHGRYWDEDNACYFVSKGWISGRVEHVNGPIAHVRTDGGRFMKWATVALLESSRRNTSTKG